MAEVQNNQQVQAAIPDVSKEDFLKRIAVGLGEVEWSDDVIQSIDPNKTQLIYLWGQRFRGTVEGKWEAKISGELKFTIDNKEIKVPDGTAYSCPFSDLNFDLLVIDDNQATPEWAKRFMNIGFLADKFQPMSTVEASGNKIEGENSGDPQSTWLKRGNAITDSFLRPIITEVATSAKAAFKLIDGLPSDFLDDWSTANSMRVSARDIDFIARNNLTEDPTPVLIPFYVIEFQYNGNTYTIVEMADAGQVVRFTMPQPVQVTETPENIYAKELAEKATMAKLVKWGWLLAIIFLFIAGFFTAIIVLIAWYIFKLIFNKSLEKRDKELQSQFMDRHKIYQEKINRQLGV